MNKPLDKVTDPAASCCSPRSYNHTVIITEGTLTERLELKWPQFRREEKGQDKEVRKLPFLSKRKHSMTMIHGKIS